MGCLQSSQESKVNPETESIESKNPENDETVLKNRKCTDLVFLIILGAFVIILVILLGYCVHYGDINRIINGYDDCGNICGQENYRYSDLGCSGANRKNEKFLLVDPSPSLANPGLVYRICVESCDGRVSYQRFLNRCLPVKQEGNEVKRSFFSKTGLTNFFDEVSEDLETCWQEIIYLCILSLGKIHILSGLFLCVVLAMKYMAGIFVWITLIGVIIVLICGTIFFWVEYSYLADETKENETIVMEKKSFYLGLAILTTIATILIGVIIYALRKRISLVIQLFKEAGKAVTSMPLLLLEPILTFLSLVFFASLWLYFSLIIESSGHIHVENNQSVRYMKDSTMLVKYQEWNCVIRLRTKSYRKDIAIPMLCRDTILVQIEFYDSTTKFYYLSNFLVVIFQFTRWYNLFALFWFVNFVVGCQHMVIAGAVATWFFTRNKSKLTSPILISFRNLILYHLGTVSMGSFLIALVNLLRALLKSLTYAIKESPSKIIQWIHKGCQCCLYIFESFLRYLTRNAYIETAMNGYGFCPAGKRAFNLLSNNALRVLAINSVGDFVLLLAKALVVLTTVLVGIELIQKKEGVYHSWVPLAVAGIFAYCVSHCFISVYEMTIDTIFICFCEDCEQNDGMNKPYFMSRGLMEFIQNSKKTLQVNENNRSAKAWSIDKTAEN